MQSRVIAAADLAALEQLLADASRSDFATTLAVVFASVAHDIEAVGRVFAAAGIDVFGASSAGEIAVDGSGESVRERSVVASLLDLDRSSYQLRLFEVGDGSSLALGAAAGCWARDTFAHPALLVVGTGLSTDGEQIVRGIQNELGAGAAIFGGLAGDDRQFTGTFVFSGQQVSSQGVIVLALDADRVAVDGIASSGWTAVGAEKTVTSADGNVVHTIDGAPALDVYKEYLGLTDDTDITIAEYPLQVERQGYSVLRAALMVAPGTRALVYAGTVPEGARVRFTCAPGTEITDQALDEIRAFRDTMPQADALVLFSCKARHTALGPMAEDEVNPIQALWGAPMVGFYTYGEIGKNKQGAVDFHNETCLLVALKER